MASLNHDSNRRSQGVPTMLTLARLQGVLPEEFKKAL
jgi:hypothetical protein